MALAGAATLWCQVGAITPAGAVTRSPEDQSGKLGYWVVRADGSVTGFGLASLGDLSRVKLPSPIVGGAAVPRGGGYWLVAANGGVYSFGDAKFLGSPGAERLNRPIVGMAATPDGAGYWLVASDGGVFAYGDAKFFGSTGHIQLNKKIVSIATTPDGRGYWLVASDGGIFAFGDADFYGSTGAKHLNRPIVGIATTPNGGGYWLVASDGGTFAYGDAAFMGSAGAGRVASPVVAIAPTGTGRGYWVAESNGTVLGYGAAPTLVAATTVRDTTEEEASRVVAILSAELMSTTTTAPPATTIPPTSSPTTAASAVAPSTTLPATTTTVPITSPTSTTRPTTTTTVPTTTATSPTTAPSYTGPYPSDATGYDVSWPQCSPLGSAATVSLPADPDFAVVGVNAGTLSSFNSCFGAEAAWAAKGLSVYIILQPAPSNSPVQETTGPEASCAATSSECEGYDWGYNYAEADLAFVRAEGYTPKAWWVDIETAEGWPTASSLQPVNAAIVQGALDAVHSSGAVVGIYSTWYQWGEITGSYLPHDQPPIWVPGAYTLSGGDLSAVGYCERAQSAGDPSLLSSAFIGFAGGFPWLVQYGYGGTATSSVDADYSCA